MMRHIKTFSDFFCIYLVINYQTRSLTLQNSESIPKEPYKLWQNRHHSMEYLLQEVLSNQKPEVVKYLLSSAIADRFCAPLCNALGELVSEAGKKNINAEAFLDWLQETNMFVISLDEEHKWFRYHHLFQDLLREQAIRRYGNDAIAKLHFQASKWFEGEGFFGEAIEHALAARNFERATEVIERNARSLLNEDKWYLLKQWLGKIPDEIISQRPELLLVQSWMHFYRQEGAAIAPLLDRIDDLLGGDAATHKFAGEVAMFRGFSWFFKNKGALSLKYLKLALERLPLAEVAYRVRSEMMFGLSSQMLGQKEPFIHQVNEWLQNQSALQPLREVRLLMTLKCIYYIDCELKTVESYLSRSRQVARLNGLENTLAWNDYFEGLCQLQRGELKAALKLLEEAEARKYVHYAPAAVDASIALVYTYQLQGQSEQAIAKLHSLEEFVSYLGPSFKIFAESCAARLALMQDRLEDAVLWLQRSSIPTTKVMIFYLEVPCLTCCRILIAEGSRSDLKEAIKLLREHTATNEAQHNSYQLIGIMALLAIAYEKQGQEEQAQFALERALTLGRPSHFIFPFLELGSPMSNLLWHHLSSGTSNADFIKLILKFNSESLAVRDFPCLANSQARTCPEQPLIEPLTVREIEVLEFLEQGLYQKEIAQNLYISPETVKTHCKNIYHKLAVKNRRSAIKKSYALNLLVPQRRINN